jgi:hypothetical protein
MAMFLDENLLTQDSFDRFTANNVKGTPAWVYASGYGAKMSGYLSGNLDNEDWLISPSFSLAKANSATLSFDHTINYVTTQKLTEQMVLVSTNYISGNPASATWTSLTIPTWPAGNNWVFVNSGSINLTNFVGNPNVHIAFKYASSTSGAATWEVKNVLVK